MKALPIMPAVFLTAISCEPKVNAAPDQERLDAACEAWCQVAVPCSTHFAAPNHGDFTTQMECESWCTSNVEEVEARAPGCFDIILDDRECAAALSCEDFEHYENWNFNQPSKYPFECYEESKAILDECNG